MGKENIKVLEEFELPDGHIFTITDEMMTRNTTMGKLLRDYMENKNISNSDDEKDEAIRNLFLSIFDKIASGDERLNFEFYMASARQA